MKKSNKTADHIDGDFKGRLQDSKKRFNKNRTPRKWGLFFVTKPDKNADHIDVGY